MTRDTKIYAALVIAAGLGVLAIAVKQWHCQDIVQYGCFLVLAMIASGLKVHVPGIEGTYSLNYLFILIAIADFSLPETVVIAIASAIVQTMWNARQRPAALQIAFNAATLSVSSGMAYVFTRTLLQPRVTANPIGLLSVAAVVYFLANTVIVSGVMARVHQRRLVAIWQDWFLCSFPYYLAGCAAAVVIGALSRNAGWPASLLVLPLMLLVHVYYVVRVRKQGQPAL